MSQRLRAGTHVCSHVVMGTVTHESYCLQTKKRNAECGRSMSPSTPTIPGSSDLTVLSPLPSCVVNSAHLHLHCSEERLIYAPLPGGVSTAE